MEGDKDDNDQSDDIKSNEGHSDKKLPMVYHSKLIGAAKMLTRILHKIIIIKQQTYLPLHQDVLMKLNLRLQP